MANQSSMFVGRQEILGEDEILGANFDDEDFIGANFDDEDFIGAPFNYPASYHPQPPALAQSAYNPYGSQQSPYYNQYAAPQQPTDYYIQGDDDPMEILSPGGAFVGDDELELAREGGASEKSALLRRKGSGSCGFDSKWTNIRGEASDSSDLDKIKKLADGGNKKAKNVMKKIAKIAKAKLSKAKVSKVSGDDSNQAGKQAARKILDSASAAKTISKDDLKKAIQLYAGSQATTKERAYVGSKMLTFLDKRKVKIAS